MEREYEILEDGSIAIEGCPLEARINERGIVYDADGIPFGELTEDETKVILWEDEPDIDLDQLEFEVEEDAGESTNELLKIN
jgi:hypothetical protein